jgi:hypothetical protein
MRIAFTLAKKKIATLWFSYALVLFLIIFFQSIMGKFEDKNQIAWGWFLSNVMPSLSLMLSIFLADVRNQNNDDTEIDRFYYRLTMGLSILYLTLLILILLMQPLIAKPIITLMNESSIYLGPFQGLVSGSLGLFFIQKGK